MSVCLKCGFVPDKQRLGVDVINAVGFSPACRAAAEALSADNTNPAKNLNMISNVQWPQATKRSPPPPPPPALHPNPR